MKVLCKILKEPVGRIMCRKKKEMIPLTNEENKSYENQIRCHVCRKLFTKNNKKSKRLLSFYRYYMNYKIIKDIPIVSHNLSSYDSHLIIKEFAREFDGELECLGENTEKYISFSVKINKKITKKDEDGNAKIVNIPYRLKFIDSSRFMLTSLSNLVDNLSNKLYNKSGLDYMIAKDDISIFRCFKCKKNYKIDFDKELINKFSNVYE